MVHFCCFCLAIRQHILHRQTQEALNSIQTHFPILVEKNPRLLIKIHSQIVIEKLLNQETMDALVYAQHHLADAWDMLEQHVTRNGQANDFDSFTLTIEDKEYIEVRIEGRKKS